MNFSTAAAALLAVVPATVSGLAPVFAPDANKFAYGIPGAPFTTDYNFDPLGFAEDKDYETIKQYREAELQHGRVAMLGALGMLVTEQPIEFHPLFETDVRDIGPAIRHLDEVRAASPFFFEILGVLIGGLELNRALTGWTAPGDVMGTGRTFKEEYFPGDVGFDPLGLAPEDPAEFLELHTKELNNGRLAMIGWAGMVAQELVNGQEIFVNAGLAPNKFDPSSVPIQF
jgi:light-harvesting complex I chlorophyll a/b binding protein 1